MNSLEWRTKKLENQVIGGASGLFAFDTDQEPPVFDKLNRVAQLYKQLSDEDRQKYARFFKLYEEHKTMLSKLDSADTQVSDVAKAELVLAYEDDLVKHLEDVKYMSEKADKVLNPAAWPDLSNYKQRLDKLETVNREQHLQSVKLDERTEELIDIYNDIITSFKNNTVIWNQRLEVYENEDRKTDEDE